MAIFREERLSPVWQEIKQSKGPSGGRGMETQALSHVCVGTHIWCDCFGKQLAIIKVAGGRNLRPSSSLPIHNLEIAFT